MHSETTYIASVKGAPETLKPMFNPGSVPDKYDQTYMELSRRGMYQNFFCNTIQFHVKKKFDTHIAGQKILKS